MSILDVNPNRITTTPPRGQCWVCDEPDSAEDLRIPALCSEECREAWVRLLAIGGGEGDAQPSVGDAA